MVEAQPVGKGRPPCILTRLPPAIGINLNALNNRVAKTLCHHNGYKAGARTYVKNALPTSGPCAQQNAVGTHLHGATVMLNSKLFKNKAI